MAVDRARETIQKQAILNYTSVLHMNIVPTVIWVEKALVDVQDSPMLLYRRPTCRGPRPSRAR